MLDRKGKEFLNPINPGRRLMAHLIDQMKNAKQRFLQEREGQTESARVSVVEKGKRLSLLGVI